METCHYLDLLKAHKIYRTNEGRWRFYDAYMEARDPEAWFRSPHVPLREGLLLFGFVQSWDPNFKGELTKFLQTYADLFELVVELKDENILEVNFTRSVKNNIALIFDRIAYSSRGRRYESTDTSKILHAIIPKLFVMWDDRIRRALVGEERNGRCYAFEFLPHMQKLALSIVESYIYEKGGNHIDACTRISLMAEGYTIAKLLDEYNYVKYTLGKSLEEIRAVSL